MMAAFIIAVRGTLTQAILLGLAATVLAYPNCVDHCLKWYVFWSAVECGGK
jgi:ABC-type nickel/cobalt efflux system permease component RcnA